QKVLETGEPQMIRRDMNAYDRRVVHVEVGAIEGVRTRSVGEGPDRRVEILLAEEGAENAES
ncbi:MAG TPA: R3H domain-containing nucleic acid-binding protein, partial [Myxococcota bacterium]|nr:R3H domain-containing nucleic acid-binding protein [Myxococcota bacterium]